MTINSIRPETEMVEYLLADRSLPPMLLLTGKWGSGKSHYVEHDLIPYLETRGKVVFLSLYGIESLNDFRDKLLSSCYLADRDSSSILNEVASGLIGGVKAGDSGTSGALGAIYSSLKGVAKHSALSRLNNFTLILDDLERVESQNLIHQIIGECLELCDKREISIITIANAEKLKESQKFIDKAFVDQVPFSTSKAEMVNIAFSGSELNDQYKEIAKRKLLELDCHNIRALKRAVRRIEKLLEKISWVEDADIDAFMTKHIGVVVAICYAHYELGDSAETIVAHSATNWLLQQSSENKKARPNYSSSLHGASRELISFVCGDIHPNQFVIEDGAIPRKASPLDAILHMGAGSLTEEQFSTGLESLLGYLTGTEERNLVGWFRCADCLENLLKMHYISKPDFIDGSVEEYVSAHIENVNFERVSGDSTNAAQKFHMRHPSLANDKLKQIYIKKYEELCSLEQSESDSGLRERIKASWCEVDPDLFEKFQHHPIIVKFGADFLYECILDWNHTDILQFSDFITAQYNIGNVEDFFSDELEPLGELIDRLKSKTPEMAPSIRLGALNTLLYTLIHIRKKLFERMAPSGQE